MNLTNPEDPYAANGEYDILFNDTGMVLVVRDI
jgi:hypothetical protein